MGWAGPGWDATTDEGGIPLSYTGPQQVLMSYAGSQEMEPRSHKSMPGPPNSGADMSWACSWHHSELALCSVDARDENWYDLGSGKCLGLLLAPLQICVVF